MNKKKIKLTGVILLFLFGLTGCGKEKSQGADSEKLCAYFNSENMDKTIPIINEFLAGLPSGDSFSKDEQNLQALTKWLKSSSCVIDATILCIGCIYTLPAISEISFTFKEKNVIQKVILDIRHTNPMTAGICSISEQNDNED